MEIQIQNRQDHQEIKIDFLKQVLERALDHLKVKDKEVSVLLVDDEQIQGLNRQYRHKDTPTDVLAFPQQDDSTPAIASQLLGDIVISIPTAQRQAQGRGHSLEQELKVLLIHGLLHLLGYDHIQDNDHTIMRQKEVELLSLI